MRFYNALLCSNSTTIASSTLAKVLKADIAMSTINKKCWSAEFSDVLHRLERSGDFQHRVRTFQTIPQSEFVVDVRKRLRSIWNQANQPGNEDQTDKAAKYHNWVALPLRSVAVDGPPFSVPRYLHLDLGKQTRAVHSATWHISGYILVRCVSRQEAGNIMMVPVISVACRQFKTKNMLFSCVLACKCATLTVFVEASICRLNSRFTTGLQYCQSDWSFLFLPSLF